MEQIGQEASTIQVERFPQALSAAAQVRQLRCACASEARRGEELRHIHVHSALRIELNTLGIAQQRRSRGALSPSALRSVVSALLKLARAVRSGWSGHSSVASSAREWRRGRFHGQIRQQCANLGIGEAGHRRAVDGDLEWAEQANGHVSHRSPLCVAPRLGRGNEELRSSTIV